MSFFGTLLNSSRSQQRWFISRNVPLDLFSDNSALARWVFAYHATHGRFPSVAATKERFPKADLLPDSKETVETSLQRILDRELFQRMTRLVSKAKKMVDEGDPMVSVSAFMRQAVGDLDTWSGDCTDADQNSRIPITAYKDRVLRESSAFSMSPSPWPFYNKLIGLCEPGEHLVVAARTSLGKTWITLYWAEYVRSLGETVLFLSKEMPRDTVLNRLECIRYGLPYSDFRKGKLSPSQLRQWYDKRDVPLKGKLIVSCYENLKGTGLDHMTQKIDEYRPSFVIVDGAYLVYPTGVRFGSDRERFAYISNYSKRAAKSKGVVILSAIQANRDAESDDGDSKPSLTNLYGADAWAQDADLVLLIAGKRAGNTRNLIIAKGRESALGDFSIHFSLTPPNFGQFAAASATALDSEFKTVT